MDIEEIKQLMSYLETSKLHKLVFKKGDVELQLEKEGDSTVVLQRPTAPLAEGAAKAELGHEIPGAYVTSPMVGTYYATPAPDHPPFVKIGDCVEESTVVCIIEAMKVLNEVKAGVKGRVEEIFIGNAQPVEFGTRLLRVV